MYTNPIGGLTTKISPNGVSDDVTSRHVRHTAKSRVRGRLDEPSTTQKHVPIYLTLFPISPMGGMY